jgi:type III restriction enzyme
LRAHRVRPSRELVKELDASSEVVAYAKLPLGFLLPSPVGDYNPDWAISFKAGSVSHIYFVAEKKGAMSTMKLREIEKTKIECASNYSKRSASVLLRIA